MKQKINVFIFIICIIFASKGSPKKHRERKGNLSPLTTCTDLAQLGDLEEEVERLSLSPTSPQSPINGRFSTPSEQEPEDLSYEELRERQERRQKLRTLASALMAKKDCLGAVSEIIRQREREDIEIEPMTKRSKPHE